jgi:opacity protein-like surface antigen
MTVKKLALLGLASVATLGASLSMAGGPAACAPAADVSGVYVGADVGAFYNDSAKTFIDGHATHTFSRSKHHVPWGWTASGLVGYQFNNNLALQVGYIWNQDQKVEQSSTALGSTGYANKFTAYNLYLAAKGMVPIMDAFSAYMLAGGAYTHANHKLSASNQTIFGNPTYVDRYKASWLSPMGALGVAYNFDQNLSMNVEWMYIMGKLSSTSGATGQDTLKRNYRGTSRLTLGANYLFAM